MLVASVLELKNTNVRDTLRNKSR